MKRFCILLIAAVLAGCTTTSEVGRPINQVSVAQIEKGKTTKEDIFLAFGQPYSTMSDSEGRETWLYMYGQSSYSMFNPASMESTGSSLTVVMKNGVVESYATAGTVLPETKVTTQ
ncbi:hypothetical protein [uncultured Endozoicomonas sp.]|uniref:hypothetical protein n=1 Tax=uncultured Endozoicomonas sp. TaxID=432652 RepID=UPI00261562C2|nr:hypothetical protein [uncultured Endozoicomonas sp.]